MWMQRLVSAILFALALGGISPGAALSFSDWPSRAVRIIVPFPAGSANDIAARGYAEGLSRRWTRPVIVENRPGADAAVAFASAQRRPHAALWHCLDDHGQSAAVGRASL